MNTPNIEYDKVNHTLKVNGNRIYLSNEAYVTDNVLEKIGIVAADLGLRLSKIEQDAILSYILIEVNELIAKKLAIYKFNKIVDLGGKLQ
jgi:hypothetical protein